MVKVQDPARSSFHHIACAVWGRRTTHRARTVVAFATTPHGCVADVSTIQNVAVGHRVVCHHTTQRVTVPGGWVGGGRQDCREVEY